jgi:hypothetical protein
MQKEHVFIMTPNNSGSTFLAHLLHTSGNVSALPRLEGCFLPELENSFPSFIGADSGITFTKMKDILSDESNYDWQKICESWNRHWDFSNKPINLDKSPPLIYADKMYKKYFTNCKFIVMVRDPIATASGTIDEIKRSFKEEKFKKWEEFYDGYKIENIISHVLESFIQCDKVIADNPENTLVITYEDLINKTEETLINIYNFIPELGQVDTTKKFFIKNRISKIQNFNVEQSGKFSQEEIEYMNNYIFKFKQNIDKDSLLFKYK